MTHPIRVLLAEDDSVNAMVVTAMLEKLGCRVEAVVDGQSAVDRGVGELDLCILDARMPVLDGFDAARALRALPGGLAIPIVGLTADDTDAVHRRALDAGMDEVLTKPVSVDALEALLKRRVRA
ncbi:MAG: response regulator [Gemmatimonadetes bacterium]|nr:response regulator [Gemmatimonadota bacterium]